jgi:hypothetical protein
MSIITATPWQGHTRRRIYIGSYRFQFCVAESRTRILSITNRLKRELKHSVFMRRSALIV